MALEPVVLFPFAVAVIGLPAVLIGLFVSPFFPRHEFMVMGVSVAIVLLSTWGLLAVSDYINDPHFELLWLVPLGLGLPYGREALDFLLAVFLFWAMLALVVGFALDWDRREREHTQSKTRRGET